MGILADVRKNRLPIGYSRGNVEMQLTGIKRVGADKEQLSASIVVKHNNSQNTHNNKTTHNRQNEQSYD